MRIYKNQDMTGKRFGKWVVIKIGTQKKHGVYYWLCKCYCGTIKEVDGSSLRRRKSISCKRCALTVDLSGKTFNFLTAISPAYGEAVGSTYWLFKCICGTIKRIRGASVLYGSTKSCGCRQGAWSSLSDEELGSKRIYRNYQYGAKVRGLNFELTMDQVFKLIKQPCYYCGELNSNKVHSKRGEKRTFIFEYNGIDRLNSNIGYVAYNCVSCCFTCNQMKMKLSVVDFLSRAHKISEFQKANQSCKLV